jgi:hypothetical protein
LFQSLNFVQSAIGRGYSESYALIHKIIHRSSTNFVDRFIVVATNEKPRPTLGAAIRGGGRETKGWMRALRTASIRWRVTVGKNRTVIRKAAREAISAQYDFKTPVEAGQVRPVTMRCSE